MGSFRNFCFLSQKWGFKEEGYPVISNYGSVFICLMISNFVAIWVANLVAQPF